MSYNAIIEKVFLDRYSAEDEEVAFVRDDLIAAATHLAVPVPRNLGDVLYTFRYRRPLPKPSGTLLPRARSGRSGGRARPPTYSDSSLSTASSPMRR